MIKKKDHNNLLSYKIYWTILGLARKNNFIRLPITIATYAYYQLFRRNKTFYFQKKIFKYFYHPYNRTVASERIIEIPLAKNILDHHNYYGKKILEVGNVLTHYFPGHHDILDKYEKGPGVINEDVENFKLLQKYDLIISISTMEHVGWSYGEKKDPEKFSRGINNLKKYLSKDGILIVTFPIFYNPYITKLIQTKKTPFNKEYFMKRVSFWNEWKEVNFDKAMKGNEYDKYFGNANILYIGIYSKSNLSPAFPYPTYSLPSPKLTLEQIIKAPYRFAKSFIDYL